CFDVWKRREIISVRGEARAKGERPPAWNPAGFTKTTNKRLILCYTLSANFMQASLGKERQLITDLATPRAARKRFGDPNRLSSFALMKRISLLMAAATAMFQPVAQPIDLPKLSLTEVAPKYFDTVTCITHAGDGSKRLFVAVQGGQIWIVQSNQV